MRARVPLVLALLATACTPTISGHPEPAGRAGGEHSTTSQPSSTLPSYQPFPDGSGFSSEPLDQPYPLPEQLWHGQTDVCEWVTPELATQAGGTGETGSSASGCNILMGGDELVQTAIVGP